MDPACPRVCLPGGCKKTHLKCNHFLVRSTSGRQKKRSSTSHPACTTEDDPGRFFKRLPGPMMALGGFFWYPSVCPSGLPLPRVTHSCREPRVKLVDQGVILGQKLLGINFLIPQRLEIDIASSHGQRYWTMPFCGTVVETT